MRSKVPSRKWTRAFTPSNAASSADISGTVGRLFQLGGRQTIRDRYERCGPRGDIVRHADPVAFLLRQNVPTELDVRQQLRGNPGIALLFQALPPPFVLRPLRLQLLFRFLATPRRLGSRALRGSQFGASALQRRIQRGTVRDAPGLMVGQTYDTAFVRKALADSR